MKTAHTPALTPPPGQTPPDTNLRFSNAKITATEVDEANPVLGLAQ